MIISYEEMLNKTIEFYNSLDISFPKDKNELAVASLTMPSYSKNYKDKYGKERYNHSSMATLGDSMCGAFLLLETYKPSRSKGDLTDDKVAVRNDHFNVIGKKLLEGHLLWDNNDLYAVKAYTNGFEALIGFISLVDVNKAQELFLKYYNGQI